MNDKTQAAIERGIQARALLENPLFKETLNTLDATYHKQWREAETVEKREDCFRYVKLIEALLQDITSIATNGMVAEKRLDELAGKDRRPEWAKLVSHWAA